MSQYTTITFQDNGCSVCVWEHNRQAWSLTHAFDVAFESVSEPAQTTETGPALPASIPTDAAGAALRAAMQEAGVQINEAVAVVPKHWVTLRVVTLPATEPSELSQMARFEAERHIPFHIERHVISHHVLEVEDIQGARVILAAIDRPPVQQVLDTLAAAGIRAVGIDVGTLCITNALFHAGVWDSDTDTTVAQVHVGNANTDIVILHGGKPIFARSIAMGGERIAELLDRSLSAPATPSNEVLDLDAGATDAEPSDLRSHLRSNRLIREIRRTLEYARREFECPGFTRIFISGHGEALPLMKEAFGTAFGVEVAMLNPFQPASGEEGARFSLDIGEDARMHPALCVPAVGACLRDEGAPYLRMDLIPHSYVEAHERHKRKRKLTLIGIVSAVVLLLVVLAGVRMVANRGARAEALREELNDNMARAREVRYRQTVVDILEANAAQQGQALSILEEISQWRDLFAGPGRMRVSVTEFNYEAGESVSVSGYAREYSDINQLVARLKDSGHFDEVRVDRQNPVGAPNNSRVQVLQFSVVGRIDGESR